MTGFAPFEKALQKAHAWLQEVGRELGTEDPQRAHAALRGVLHALRDRLTVDEAAQLAAQLPVLIRGIYYEGWDPSKVPVKVRHREDFLALVEKHLGKMDVVTPEEAVPAVFAVIRRHVSEGEVEDVLASMPQEIRELLAA
jgi:uncharacterized protein (DUF2267 family)